MSVISFPRDTPPLAAILAASFTKTPLEIKPTDSLEVAELTAGYRSFQSICRVGFFKFSQTDAPSPSLNTASGSFPIAHHILMTSGAKKLLATPEEIAPWESISGQIKSTSDPSEFVTLNGTLNQHLTLRTFFVGHSLSLADFYVFESLKLSPLLGDVIQQRQKQFPHLLRWLRHMDSLPPVKSATAYLPASLASQVVATPPRIASSSAPSAATGPDTSSSKAATATKNTSGSFDKIKLTNASVGNVVTRFPPEPSGYLHIGHIKAALLNNYYARTYNGKMVLRFDDTNPSKEKVEYIDNIISDLAYMDIKPDVVSYTSDHFDMIAQAMEKLLKEGKAYCDATPLEQMRDERMHGIESPYRNSSPEENLRVWELMKAGDPEGLKYVVRAKIDMTCKNKALRDPSLYRCNLTPHHRTGTKYKVYPLYDFAIPIVDSFEGVTHALRTNEYHDRNPLYNWVGEAAGVRVPAIEDFSRLAFTYTLLSKRKLQWFVDNGYVDGWNDPRFPTIQGVARRGLTVEALRQFILSQGASKSTVMMDVDALWALNRKILDPIVPRYTAIAPTCKWTLSNGPSPAECKSQPRHRKNPDLGDKAVWYSDTILIEPEDAQTLKAGEEVTLMNWGNAIVESLQTDESGRVVALSGRLNLAGDIKATEKKLTWVADTPDVCPVKIVEYDVLITKPKLDPEDDWKKYINPNSMFETSCIGDGELRKLAVGDKIQLERRGYFICDRPAEGNTPVTLISIPDGRATNKMSTLSSKVAHKR